MDKIKDLIGRNRRILPGIALIFVLVSLLVIRAGYNHHIEVLSEIELNQERLATYQSMLSRSDAISELKKSGSERLESLEKGLIMADKPSLGAAVLQETIKTYSSKHGIAVTSEKTLGAANFGEYTRVPVEFQFKARLDQLKDLLYDIRRSDLVLGVKSLRLKSEENDVTGIVDVSMVVEGAIRR